MAILNPALQKDMESDGKNIDLSSENDYGAIGEKLNSLRAELQDSLAQIKGPMDDQIKLLDGALGIHSVLKANDNAGKTPGFTPGG